METIFAPWRGEYINGIGNHAKNPDNPQECVFCSAIKATDDFERYIIYRGINAFVILNLYPYNNGHMLIIPYNHVSDLSQLNTETHHEMMDLIVKAQKVLQDVYHPHGMNIGANIGTAAGAGIDQHLHFHILPRWTADVNFMTTIGQTRVIPEKLDETWKKIRTSWQKID
ncbi:MAG TPA: HIT domain-containing protein [Flexilinea sp.]|nr:HIT domain-containing protein [Flexilinea sp.]